MTDSEEFFQQEDFRDEESIDKLTLETFYVYRSLHSDESWGAVLGGQSAESLPNIDFGMTVYAKNEKQAIARGRDLYEKIHKFDSDRDNVRRFAAAIVKSVTKDHLRRSSNGKLSEGELESIKQETMRVAIALNDGFTEHFNRLDAEFLKGLKV